MKSVEEGRRGLVVQTRRNESSDFEIFSKSLRFCIVVVVPSTTLNNPLPPSTTFHPRYGAYRRIGTGIGTGTCITV